MPARWRGGRDPKLSRTPFDPASGKTQSKSWRIARIDRFRALQQYDREWINFAEIADWCSREDGSIAPNEQKRAMAFDSLEKDLLAGEFEENCRSRVLYLHPFTTKARMTREWLTDVIEHNCDLSHGRSEYCHAAGFLGKHLRDG